MTGKGVNRAARGAAGFTVIELMITLVVMAVMLAIAIPNLRGVMARNQLLAQTTQLASALAMARSEAVSRSVQAGVCASADGATCSGSANDWSSFKLVFVDLDGGDDFDAGTEPLLRVYASNSEVDQTAAAASYFFNPAGFSTLAGNSTVELCHEDLDESNRCRRLTIQPSGAVSVATYHEST